MVEIPAPRIRPNIPITPEEIGAASVGSLLGSFSPLSDLGFGTGPSSDVNVTDEINVEVTKNQPWQWPWGIPKIPVPDYWPIPTKPTEKDTTDTVYINQYIDLYPLDSETPFTSSSGVNEALQARDSLFWYKKTGEPNFEPKTPKDTYLEEQAAGYVTLRLRGSGSKRYSRKGELLTPCRVEYLARQQGVDFRKRRHVRTGNSKARTKQIRRTYAFAGCH